MKNSFKKSLALLLATVTICFAATPVSAVSKSADEAITWVKSQVGKPLDIDNNGCWCVDLIYYYYQYLGVAIQYGDAADFATNALPSGWTRTKGGKPQKGDILVYTDGGLGHVAIYESDYSHYHQNINGKMYVVNMTNLYTLPGYSPTTYWGCIHPNFAGSNPGKSTLYGVKSRYTVGSEIAFNWSETANTTHYNLNIYKMDSSGEYKTYSPLYPCFYATSGKKLKFDEAGQYRALVQSTNSNVWVNNSWAYTNSDYIYFNIGYDVSFNLNGGEIEGNLVSSIAFDYLNVSRGDKCSVLTSSFGSTTGANQYGREVLVNANNQVIEYRDYGKTNGGIPSGGFTISAHADSPAFPWLKTVSVGDYIVYDTTDMSLKRYDSQDAMLYDTEIAADGKPLGILPVPHKDGYVFSGWQLNGLTVTPHTVYSGNSDIYLQASWIPALKTDNSTVCAGSEYIYVDTPMTYEQARNYCVSNGGYLAKIESQIENYIVLDLIHSKDNPIVYINGSDSANDETWLFSDGTAMYYFNWSSVAPNGKAAENSMIIYPFSGGAHCAGEWDDVSGTGLYPFVMEKPYTMTNLSIISPPNKTVYIVGDTLDTTGLTLEATYNGSIKETITEGFTCDKATFATTGAQAVAVSYGGKTCTFDVDVIAVAPVSIAVKATPTKLNYFVGDTLDTAGLSIELTNNSGTKETKASGFTCSPITLSTAGEQTITVSYGGKTCTFKVDVIAVALESIAVKAAPTKTNYFVGDTLKTAGLSIELTNNNGTKETKTSGFTCSPTTLSTVGKQTITVSYGGKTCTFKVDVIAVALESIAVKAAPNKTNYFAGDALDTAGLSIELTNNNDTKETKTSGFTCSPTTLSTVGKQTITVSYGGKTCTFDVTVIAESIVYPTVAINNNPGTKTINYGEELKLKATVTNRPEGAVIVWYINGTEKGRGDEFTAPAGTADYTVTVKIVNKDGNIIKNAENKEITAEEKVTVKAGFFQKLINFFKNLFGAIRIVPQAFKEF